MTTSTRKALADDAARRTAILAHDRSLLVEAGAGSGKTAVMAGRIAMMLAAGIAPRKIAAVTFTELAASELLMRVRDFVGRLLVGDVPAELCVALPEGLSEAQRRNLETANATIDEILCSTIHGFCQRLIAPYPVEADIDPGAAVMDRDEADLVFEEIIERWLREKLSGEEDGLLAEMVLREAGATVALVKEILGRLRAHRTAAPPPAPSLQRLVKTFRAQAKAFASFVKQSKVAEPETISVAKCFGEMADAVVVAETRHDPASLISLLVSRAHGDLCKKDGSFLKLRKKIKWGAAASKAGYDEVTGEQLYLTAVEHHAACCATWSTMLEGTATRVLCDLVEELRPVLDEFRRHKRSAAQLDFDDLIHAARALLRDHDDVRRALADRHAHVLVDEFQDTDPLQIEIFWRLCGERPKGASAARWEKFQIRPGALFLVGDPKQAIYRFRGADVNAYLRARDALIAQDANSVVSIATNFRSRTPILTYVNARFQALLSSDGQPGFTPLLPFVGAPKGALCVAALDVGVAGGSAEQLRDGEAEAIAEMCERLIGNEPVADQKSGKSRPCRPGDIALLAPTGSDLWRYEEALERHGVPVSTQAGKGLYRRQEIQDLIALTRVLANQRDTLALGALLRGPLVGLTEEEILDIVWALPRPADDPEALPRLDLGVDPGEIQNALAQDVFRKLQALRRCVNSTTPHNLLSQAVDVLRVRPILLQRHRRQAERALANVDLYLNLSRAYSVRGLRAFADAMTAAWTDEARAVEGRPDAQEEAVALYTMHAAKGLEWPIVVPINTMTAIKAADTSVIDRLNDRFYCPVFGVAPAGHGLARENETAELARERVRLWYVATTRARELLVIPRLSASPSRSSWSSLLDLALATLPAIDLANYPTTSAASKAPAANAQTRERFAQEAATIAAASHRLQWRVPSRDEGASGPVTHVAAPSLIAADDNNHPDPVDAGELLAVQGGRERGLVIHKLLEEVLTRESGDDLAALSDRAKSLIAALGQTAFDDPAKGLSPTEIAGCVARTLALPEIAALRPTLVPEFPVYGSECSEGVEHVTAGVADAISLNADGNARTVIDWKSDVNPTRQAVNHYYAQVRNYLATTGAERGLVVFVTSGVVVPVDSSVHG